MAPDSLPPMTTQHPPDGELWTRYEAADFAHVTPQTIDRWVADGRLPAYRIGRRILIKASDMMALLKPTGGAE